MNTKNAILLNSSLLFSRSSYSSVSMRNIADITGIKGSSIYNHFKNKEDILLTIINYYSNYMKSNIYKIVKPYISHKNCKNISDEDAFFDFAMRLFTFIFKDEISIKFRKILLLERFERQDLSLIFDDIYINNIINYLQIIFGKMMRDNVLVESNPYLLAISFYSPVIIYFYKLEDVDKENYYIVNEHLKEFFRIYKSK